MARVTCDNGTCQIVQASATIRVRGVSYRARTTGTGTFAAGESRTVQVEVPRKAYNRLRTKKSGSVNLVLRAEGTAGDVTTSKTKNLSNGLRR